MVQQHLMMCLWDRHGIAIRELMGRYTVTVILNGFGGLAAPLFITIAGFGVAATYTRRRNPARTLFIRGAILLGFGYLLNMLVPTWFSPGSWYVLHLLGAMLVLSPLFMQLRSETAMISAASVVLILSAAIQNWLHIPLAHGNVQMNDVTQSGGIFRLALAGGHFPFFPWTAFFLVGVVAGQRCLAGNVKKIWILAVFCIISAGVMAIIRWMYGPMNTPALYFFGISTRIYPLLLIPALFLMALTLALIALVLRYDMVTTNVVIHPLTSLGRISLTVLFVHILIFKELGVRLGFARIFSQPVAAAITVVTVLLFIGIAGLWKRIEYRYSLEWLMRLVAT